MADSSEMELEMEYENELQLCDPYLNDPVPFSSESELSRFMEDCGEGQAQGGLCDNTSPVDRVCTCLKCEDLDYGEGTHLCCQQFGKWKQIVDTSEARKFVTETQPFKDCTNKGIHTEQEHLSLILYNLTILFDDSQYH
jgi:hypothetical protein